MLLILVLRQPQHKPSVYFVRKNNHLYAAFAEGVQNQPETRSFEAPAKFSETPLRTMISKERKPFLSLLSLLVCFLINQSSKKL